MSGGAGLTATVAAVAAKGGHEIFFPIIASERVKLRPHELHANFRDVVLQKLRAGVEGKCTRYGYIRRGSVAIHKISLGRIETAMLNGDTTFVVSFQCDVSNPARDAIIPSIVATANNKFGVLCHSGTYSESADGRRKFVPVLQIVVPRQIVQSEVDLRGVAVGDALDVQVLGTKFNLNDSKIRITARAVAHYPASVAADATRSKDPRRLPAELMETGEADDGNAYAAEDGVAAAAADDDEASVEDEDARRDADDSGADDQEDEAHTARGGNGRVMASSGPSAERQRRARAIVKRLVAGDSGNEDEEDEDHEDHEDDAASAAASASADADNASAASDYPRREGRPHGIVARPRRNDARRNATATAAPSAARAGQALTRADEDSTDAPSDPDGGDDLDGDPPSGYGDAEDDGEEASDADV